MAVDRSYTRILGVSSTYFRLSRCSLLVTPDAVFGGLSVTLFTANSAFSQVQIRDRRAPPAIVLERLQLVESPTIRRHRRTPNGLPMRTYSSYCVQPAIAEVEDCAYQRRLDGQLKQHRLLATRDPYQSCKKGLGHNFRKTGKFEPLPSQPEYPNNGTSSCACRATRMQSFMCSSPR